MQHIRVEMCIRDRASTNGRVTVSYDSAKLVLTDIASPLEASANRKADSAVELAYAAARELPGNETLALLTFQVKAGATGDTEIRIHKMCIRDSSRTDPAGRTDRRPAH